MFLSPTPSPTDSAVYKAVFDYPGIGVPELRKRTKLPDDIIKTALANLIHTGWLRERIYDDGPGYGAPAAATHRSRLKKEPVK